MHTFEKWKKKLIVVRGGGDIATGTIYKLHPEQISCIGIGNCESSYIRRTISFCEAVFDKEVEVEGVIAKRADLIRRGICNL
ncbi:MAG: hypothetical protein ACLTS6_16985 [Anaerobutyricum sp.]